MVGEFVGFSKKNFNNDRETCRKRYEHEHEHDQEHEQEHDQEREQETVICTIYIELELHTRCLTTTHNHTTTHNVHMNKRTSCRV